jgi:uncharacterized DUF497 family protein
MGKTVISEDGRFEWEDDKSRINKELHGLYFDDILPAFDDPYLLEMYDETHSTLAEPPEEKVYYEWRKNFIP